MSTIKQTLALMKQELRSASRTRYIVISFVLMPLIMWGLQGGVQMLVGFSLTSTQEGGTIYVANFDEGNETDKLGDLFVQYLKYASSEVNTSYIYNSTINDTRYNSTTYSELSSKLNDEDEKQTLDFPLLIIPENFTAVYNAYNYSVNRNMSTVELYTLPGGIIGSELLQAGIWEVLQWNPFTLVDINKQSSLNSKVITFRGEESAASGFGVGFIGFISVIIAVMAPAPFVSTSFAGEREKKTMESLLALPISRFNILFGKLLAGMVLVSIFAVMNMIGLLGFSFVLGLGDTGGDFNTAELYTIDPSLILLVLIGVTMFLSAFVSIGIGISVASLTKDVRSAESLYSMIMLLPSMIVGMSAMFGSLPEQSFGGAGIVLYLIPWSHAIAILSKGLYPQTYAKTAITGSIPLDLLFHLGSLVLVIMIALFIASRVFEREGILT
ncbi:MAG: ABC transporter permease [Candidatus Hodarchaeales archaeon]|jgi:ABC-type Na+ efflux pump permease subunit